MSTTPIVAGPGPGSAASVDAIADAIADRVIERAGDRIAAMVANPMVTVEFGRPVVTRASREDSEDLWVTEHIERLRAVIRAYHARFGPIENMDALQPGDLE